MTNLAICRLPHGVAACDDDELIVVYHRMLIAEPTEEDWRQLESEVVYDAEH